MTVLLVLGSIALGAVTLARAVATAAERIDQAIEDAYNPDYQPPGWPPLRRDQ